MRPQRFSCGIFIGVVRSRRTIHCFNEAAAFQLRNPATHVDFEGFDDASMRPQRFSCGIARVERHQRDDRHASMRPQRFSCGIRPIPAARPFASCSFNEAAAFQLRNPPSGTNHLPRRRLLQ